jgi:hypothetical protein
MVKFTSYAPKKRKENYMLSTSFPNLNIPSFLSTNTMLERFQILEHFGFQIFGLECSTSEVHANVPKTNTSCPKNFK